MNQQVVESPTTTVGRREKLSVVDCDAHPWPTPADMAPYLSENWRKYLSMVGLRTPSEIGLIRDRPMAARTDAWSPEGAIPGNDPEFFGIDLLDKYGIDIAILNSQAQVQQSIVGGNQPLEFTAEMMRAANDWSADVFLDDPRLYSSICAPFEYASNAVREIERWADNPRWVQVLLPFKTHHPAGNQRYWPIYEVATHHGLPIAFHPGSNGMNTVTGVGWPSYYYEEHSGFNLALLTLISSLIFEGVFDKFPDLKIVICEGGFSWVTPFGWRMDRSWRQLRDEVPHLQRKPSEYLREHFWFTTQPIEEPEKPEQLMDAFETFGMMDKLLYSSDYPHWDFDAPDPKVLFPQLPVDMQRKIFSETALELYGLSIPAGGE